MLHLLPFGQQQFQLSTAKLEHQVQTDNGIAIGTFHSMATTVIVSTVRESATVPEEAVEITRGIFHEVEQQCSRFNPTSDLSKINSSPTLLHEVERFCFLAVQEAYLAYSDTGGLFDPRILTDLMNLGYDKSWIDQTPSAKSFSQQIVRGALGKWQPKFIEPNLINVGEHPIDLGGIGKGLALRWSGEHLLQRDHSNVLIEAGGDCLCIGYGPDNAGWNIGIQNPLTPEGPPISVLNLANTAVCTSSVAVRNWWRNGSFTHHLILPSTGKPANNGLLAVTVVAPDPAMGEVWAKSLFLLGKEEIENCCEMNNLNAVWVCDNGEMHFSKNVIPFIIWENSEI